MVEKISPMNHNALSVWPMDGGYYIQDPDGYQFVVIDNGERIKVSYVEQLPTLVGPPDGVMVYNIDEDSWCNPILRETKK